ncbi:hypothetical protein LEP1GSC020_3159 [Leptospira interrogans serovar Grippotyphosa str. 2006006986]|nr:hypothetical protein LEP1GSC009_4121 [Leptospira interrogans serovar Grippotyphosa str. Andaman]EKP83658.1 hypothetical protein LEP1GSC020_3159 [Leptospira interrogans serovar Grippotyphosa str. 2006006986]
MVYDLEEKMNQMYFGRVTFLDGDLFVSLPFVLEAPSIYQVFSLIQIKYKIAEKDILDLEITNRKAISTRKDRSLIGWKENNYE